MNSVRQQFVWSINNHNDSMNFQIYKLTVATYLVSMCFYGWIDQLNPHIVYGLKFTSTPYIINDNFIGSHWYTDYVSNWSDMVCSVWAMISAYDAVVPNASDNIKRLLGALNSVAPTWTIAISYWYWVSSLPSQNSCQNIV